MKEIEANKHDEAGTVIENEFFHPLESNNTIELK